MYGFVTTIGNKYYFYQTENTRRTDKLVKDISRAILKAKGRSCIEIDEALNNPQTMGYVKYYTDRAYLYKVITATGYTYYTIGGDGWQAGIPCTDFYRDVVLLNIDEPQITVRDNRGTIDFDYACELVQKMTLDKY